MKSFSHNNRRRLELRAGRRGEKLSPSWCWCRVFSFGCLPAVLLLLPSQLLFFFFQQCERENLSDFPFPSQYLYSTSKIIMAAGMARSAASETHLCARWNVASRLADSSLSQSKCLTHRHTMQTDSAKAAPTLHHSFPLKAN